MLLDNVEVKLSAGHGGAGKVSFKKMGRGPDGGNGGKGGDVYLKTSGDLTLLNQFSKKVIISAADGENGGASNKSGKKGDDLTIFLPIGTSLIEKSSGKTLFELDKDGDKFMLLKGGIGGKGNFELRSNKNTTPLKAQGGRPGESLNLILNLRLIADFGLIGLPNAGKSSLLNELTGTSAKTANYAFTTLEPNLGILDGHVIADIPGLIEGASEGKGLGIKFLKHIEKVKVLIHCIDSNSTNYLSNYETVRNELAQYNPDLLKKKEIIVLTKSDSVDRNVKFKNSISVSIHDLRSLDNLKSMLLTLQNN